MTPNATRLIPFDVGHISLMDLRGDYIDDVFTEKNGIDHLEECARIGDSFTLISEGRILCVGGIFPLWPGVGQVWLIPSVHGLAKPMVFVRHIKRMLNSMQETGKYHRVQAIISTQLTRGDRWIEYLGFTKEGLLRKYTPQGTDYFMYAKVV